MRKNPSIDFELTVNNKTATYSAIRGAKARHDQQPSPRRNTTLLLMSGVDDGAGCYVDFIGTRIQVRFPGHNGGTIQAKTVTAATDYAWGYLRNAGGHPKLFARPNPSSYAGDPYWTRARFKGACCKCQGVVRKGDPIYYYPKGKKVYCDGASCGKAANQDFISMRDDEDMYNRRNPSRRNPDYDALNKEHRRLKTMLTRAVNSKDPKKVIAACRAAVKAWESWPAWPDDWSKWERALGDAQTWGPDRVSIEDLARRSNPKRRNPSKADRYKLVRSRQRHLGNRLWDVIDTKKGVRVVSGETFTIASQACSSYNGDTRGVAGEIQEWARPNPSHPDCPGVSGFHQHYQGKCATDWNWGVGKSSAIAIKTWPKHGVVAMVRPSWEAGLWDWEVKVNGKVIADGNAKSSNHAKKWCVETVGRTFGRSTSRRSNPSLGMPGMPHTWVTAKGVHVSAGDTVEYWSKEGLAYDARPEKRRAKVLNYLIFDDHVQVKRGSFGNTVDDRNFIRVVRRA